VLAFGISYIHYIESATNRSKQMNTTSQTTSIQHVTRKTGCTEDQARKELIAEEWNDSDAIRNIRQAQTQGVI
jgi:hypothetical protein